MRANGDPSRALPAAIVTSQASAIPRPTPRQAPCPAANVGSSRYRILLKSGLKVSARID
jgi:hypothetical protein